MERVEPAVPGRFPGAVIAVEIFVMQLVEEIAQLNAVLAFHFQFLKPRMRGRRTDTVVKQQKQHMDGMRRDQEEEQGVGHENEALDRMHRET